MKHGLFLVVKSLIHSTQQACEAWTFFAWSGAKPLEFAQLQWAVAHPKSYHPHFPSHVARVEQGNSTTSLHNIGPFRRPCAALGTPDWQCTIPHQTNSMHDGHTPPDQADSGNCNRTYSTKYFPPCPKESKHQKRQFLRSLLDILKQQTSVDEFIPATSRTASAIQIGHWWISLIQGFSENSERIIQSRGLSQMKRMKRKQEELWSNLCKTLWKECLENLCHSGTQYEQNQQ